MAINIAGAIPVRPSVMSSIPAAGVVPPSIRLSSAPQAQVRHKQPQAPPTPQLLKIVASQPAHTQIISLSAARPIVCCIYMIAANEN